MSAKEWRALGWLIYSLGLPLAPLYGVALGTQDEHWVMRVLLSCCAWVPLWLGRNLCVLRAERAENEVTS